MDAFVRTYVFGLKVAYSFIAGGTTMFYEAALYPTEFGVPKMSGLREIGIQVIFRCAF